eukprot:sb/3470464/
MGEGEFQPSPHFSIIIGGRTIQRVTIRDSTPRTSSCSRPRIRASLLSVSSGNLVWKPRQFACSTRTSWGSQHNIRNFKHFFRIFCRVELWGKTGRFPAPRRVEPKQTKVGFFEVVTGWLPLGGAGVFICTSESCFGSHALVSWPIWSNQSFTDSQRFGPAKRQNARRANLYYYIYECTNLTRKSLNYGSEKVPDIIMITWITTN